MAQNFYEKMKKDRMTAMKEKNTILKNLLSTVLGQIENKLKSDSKFSLDDTVISAFTKNMIKTNDIAIEKIKEKGGDASKFIEESAILENYVLKQLSEEEINIILTKYIKEDGLNTLPLVFEKMKLEYNGLFDGNYVRKTFSTMI